MFGIGVPELILILVVGLIVFGPGKLPEMGRSFRKASNALTAAINAPEPPPAPPAAAPAAQPAAQATAETPAAAPMPTATPTAATAAAAVEAHRAEQNTSNTENRA